MKLINKIKPEVLEALKTAKIKYNASYRLIIATFNDNNDYRDLSIREVDTIITFLPEELRPNGRLDFYWGDYILQKEYQF